MTIQETIKKYRVTILLSIIIFILLQLLAGYFRGIAKDIATDSFAPYAENAVRYQKMVNGGNMSKLEATKALEVLDLAEGHKKHHEEIALNTFRFRYTTVTMLMICSIIMAAFLLYITPKGWNNVNDHLKVIMLLFVAHSAFYGGSTVVYGQEATLKENVEQYITFDNIQKQLITDVIIYQLADSIAKDTLTNKFHISIAQTNEKIILANDVKFNLQEYKASVETLKEYLPEASE